MDIFFAQPLALLTAQQWTDALPGVALVVTALGSLLAAIIGALTLHRSGKVLKKADSIETLTNGAARSSAGEMRALRADIDHLREQLAESRQAAADVRVALDRPPPAAAESGR